MGILDNISFSLTDLTPARVLPILIGLYLLMFFIYYIRALQPQQGTTEWINMEVSTNRLTFLNRLYPMRSGDTATFVMLTILFFFLAIFNIGDMRPVDVLGEIEFPSENRTHMNNMFFDEIYFVRTAAEHIVSVNPYEISHPPLGKEIIAASMMFFGMSPLGWRLMGALFGVVMLMVMYVFAKNMFGKTIVASCATMLFGFDFMRFVQTRIATVDSFLILFILLAFYFMYRHVTTDADDPFHKSLLPLALSGFFFGLSVAVKWIGFYAGVGLLIIYVIRLVQLGFHYSTTEKSGFGEYLRNTLLFSALFFVVIPAIIYYLTYIPYGLARGMTLSGGLLWDAGFIQLFWQNQVSMFTYHSMLTAEHPFSSVWWQWILNIRPILYVNSAYGDLRASFGAFGNPVVWWGGFLAMIAMAIRVFTHKDGKALFILIGYLSQLLPWIAVPRILFAYHYFPSTLFLILALAHVFNTIRDRSITSGKPMIYGYVIVTCAVFAVFYPALSGVYLPHWYFSDFLRWFTTWPF